MASRRTTYEHVVALKGDSTGLVRAADSSSNALRRLDESSRRGQKSLDQYNYSVRTATTGMSGLSRIVGGFSLGYLARELIQTADSMLLLDGRLKLVTGSSYELAAVQGKLFDVAQDTRSSIEATTNFYVRLRQRLGEATIGTLELTDVTRLVSKTLIIGGATAKETSASLLQLSQALSSGLLRGDEFRSLSENATGLMDAIAKGAGRTQAELRELSMSGQLTTEFILNALQKQAPLINEQFESLPITFGQAIQQMQNIGVDAVSDFNREFDFTGKLVDGVAFLSNHLDKLAGVMGVLIAMRVGSYFSELAERVVASTAAIGGETLAQQRNTQATLAAVSAKRAKLVMQYEHIKSHIELTRNTIATAKSTDVLAAAEARLAALEGRLIVAKKQLNAATLNQMVVQTKASEATRLLTASTSALGRIVGFLGGPVGIALMAAQAIFLFDVFDDGAKKVELTTESSDKLHKTLVSLQGATYDQLVAERALADAELVRLNNLNLTDEATLQNIRIQEEKIKIIEQEKLATLEGLEARIALARQEVESRSEALAAAQEELDRKSQIIEQNISMNASVGGLAASSAILAAAHKAVAAATEEEGVAKEALLGLERDLAALKERSVELENDGEQRRKELITSLENEVSARNALKIQLEDALSLQAEDITGSGTLAEKQAVLDALVKKLTESIHGKNKATRESKTASEQLLEREKKLEESLANLKESFEKNGSPAFAKEIERLEKQLAEFRGETVGTSVKVEELIGKYNRNEITAKELRDMLKQLKLAQEAVNGVMQESGASIDLAEQAMRDYIQSQEDQLAIQRIANVEGEAAARIYEKLVAIAKEYEIPLEVLKEQHGDLIEQMIEFGKREEEIKRINAAYEDIASTLAGVIVEGDNLADAMKDLWKRMVKDLIESGLLTLIKSIFDGEKGLDFSGFIPSFGGKDSGGGIISQLFGKAAADKGKEAILSQLTGTQLGNALGIGSGTGTLVGNGINSLFGGGTQVGNAINNIAASLGIGTGAAGVGVNAAGIQALNSQASLQLLSGIPAGAPATTTATTVASTAPASQGFGLSGSAALQGLGAVLGGYNIYKGLSQGGSAGIGRAIGGGATLMGSLGMFGAANPAIAIAGLVLSTLLAGRGARDYSQILQEDYLPDILGMNVGSAIGAGGGLGFAGGGNTAIFGANYGIRGTGITEQLGVNNGENGNYAFFTGAQRALDGFEAALRAAGITNIKNEAGTLAVTSSDVTVEQMREIWGQYAETLTETVSYNETFATAVENNLLGMDTHAKLFFENFAIGMGQSAFEARESILQMDTAFDKLVQDGMAGSDALFRVISDHYGLSLEQAQFFVEQSGVSLEQWLTNLTNKSGDALAELLEFNADGVTAFESSIADMSATGEAFVNQLGDQFSSVAKFADEAARAAYNAYANRLGNLPNLFPDGTARGRSGSGLGNFASAMSGSETVSPSGGSVNDQLYAIGVNSRESVTVNRKGMIERIDQKLDHLLTGGSTKDDLLVAINTLVKELRTERVRPNARI